MDTVRVSKELDKLIFQFYETGALTPHTYLSELGEERPYLSTPDSESIISAFNFLVSREGTQLLCRQLSEGKDVVVEDIIFSYPANGFTTKPPHPDMIDTGEINNYHWPTTEMSLNQETYLCRVNVIMRYDESVLVDVLGSNVRKTEVRPVRREYELVNFPCQVGSARCNLAVMRSYLDDPRYSEKVMSFLKSRLWEPYAPDGYFIIKGRAKRIAINDKLQMNIPYVVKPGSDVINVIRDRVCEVRSMKADKGVYTHKVYFPVINETKTKTIKENGMDKDTYRLLSAGLAIHIDRVFRKNDRRVVNVLQFIAFYVAIVFPDRSISDEIDRFIKLVNEYSNYDTEINTVMSVTKSRLTDLNGESLRLRASELFNFPGDRRVELSDDDVIFVRDKFLPHCDSSADAYENFQSKLRFLAIMCIDVCLAVLDDPKTGERRMDNTDRKSFIYKRWETAGYLFKEYIRQLFLAFYPSRDDIDQKFGDMSAFKDNVIDLMHANKIPNKVKKKNAMKDNDFKDNLVADCLLGSPIAMLDSLLTIKISVNNGPNAAPARKIHPSQFGFQCPANTPENANIGLINNIAEAALITNELTIGQRDALNRCIDDLGEGGDTLLIFDGVPIKNVRDDAYDRLIAMRRDGLMPFMVSISRYYLWQTVFKKGLKVINVTSSHGRPLQPMISLRSMKAHEILKMDFSKETIPSLLKKGIIEFLDATELSYNGYVAETLDTATDDHTHCLIKRSYVTSKTTNCLVFLENNTAQRSTLGSQHLKQAVGRLFLHDRYRADHDTNFLLKPELPLMMSDTMRRIYNPRYRIDADIGHGKTVNVCCMPFNGNNDDGIHFSESFAKSRHFRGNYVSMLRSEKYYTIASKSFYNWRVDPMTNTEVVDDRGRGIPDPDFSDSIILDYGRWFKVMIRESDIEESMKVNGLYEIFDGEFYKVTGFKKVYRVHHSDGSSREVIVGKDTINIGKEIASVEVVDTILIMSLYRITDDREDAFGREEIEIYEEIENIDDRPIDKRFLTSDRDGLLMMGEVRIPRTDGKVRGTPLFISGRRKISRKDVGVKVISRMIDNPHVVDISKNDSDRFEVSFGFIDHIQIVKNRETVMIRVIMPTDVKPGNKYASFHAQKNVCAKIKPDDEMPIAEYVNTVTGETETMRFDIVFNSLSIPSRMTIGILLEIQIVGTLKYIYENVLGLNIHDRTQNPSYTPLSDDQWKKLEERGIFRHEIELLTDATTFMYEADYKMKLNMDIRRRLGIPEDSKYKLKGVENPILCGSLYYGVLHHLVDNKARARGFTGKKDPVTGQMVKGRKRDGGAVTGTMESDGYKSHGAIAMLHERMAVVSDQTVFNRCPYCTGLVAVTRTPTHTFGRCNDCQRRVDEKDILRHRSVKYINLYQHYLRSMGVDLKFHLE